MSNFSLTDIERGAKQWADDLTRAANRGERISTMYVQPADLLGLCASHRALRDEIERWEEWSNSIAEQMPEHYDGDEAQEAIIDRWIHDLRSLAQYVADGNLCDGHLMAEARRLVGSPERRTGFGLETDLLLEAIEAGERDNTGLEALREWLCSDEVQYVPSMDGDTLDALARRLFVAVTAPSRCENCGKTMAEHDALARCLRQRAAPEFWR